jgi:hypothetical protein
MATPKGRKPESYAAWLARIGEVGVQFIDLARRVNELHAMGHLVFEIIDGERSYSLSPTRVQPGSVVWNDMQREVA